MRQKFYISRSLSDLPSLPKILSTVQAVSLQKIGQSNFVEALLTASQGDPFETSTPESAQEDFEALITYAGAAFDPSHWLVLNHNDEVLGVVLPQVYVDKPEIGTLFYLGVVPAHRGKGLGRAFHLLGLHHLKDYGAKEYQGSTDVENRAMRHIFAVNGCQQQPTVF